MGLVALHHPFAIIFGILGNIFSTLVYAAPIPTFLRIYRNRTTEQFQCTPYIVALVNALFWGYYSILAEEYALLTINIIGAMLRIAYILIFVRYAEHARKVQTVGLTLLLCVGLFPVMVLLTSLLTSGSQRIQVVGWISVASAILSFAAPLTILRQVIQTKSVEYMPLPLSLLMSLSAVAWTVFGIFRRDIHITIPSALGLVFGLIQIVLYVMFMNNTSREANQVEMEDAVEMGTAM